MGLYLYDLGDSSWYLYNGKSMTKTSRPIEGTPINGYCFNDGQQIIGYFLQSKQFIIFNNEKGILVDPKTTRCNHKKNNGLNDLTIYNNKTNQELLKMSYFFDETFDFDDPYDSKVNIGDRISAYLSSEEIITKYINSDLSIVKDIFSKKK